MSVAAVATVADNPKNGGFLRVLEKCRTAVARKAATVGARTDFLPEPCATPIFGNGGFLRFSALMGSGLTRGRGGVRAPSAFGLQGALKPVNPVWGGDERESR